MSDKLCQLLAKFNHHKSCHLVGGHIASALLSRNTRITKAQAQKRTATVKPSTFVLQHFTKKHLKRKE